MNQIISYMYVKQAEIGGFIYPSKSIGKLKYKNIGKLNGFGGNVKTWSISIPQTSENFKEFIKIMNKNEQELKLSLTTEERAAAQQNI